MKLRFHNIYIPSLAVILTALLLVSCGTKKRVVRGDSGQKGSPRTETVILAGNKRAEDRRADDARYAVDREIADRLVAEARKWLGVRYKYGGNDTHGVDCSGLTMNVFSKAAGVKIPRNSGAQMEYTMPLEQKHLQPGDLVFFSPSAGSNSVNHVGLYIGDRRMIHASSSRGVMISSLDERYFVTRYHSSGRVAAVTYHATHRTPPSGSNQAQDVLVADAAPASDKARKSSRKPAKKADDKRNKREKAQRRSDKEDNGKTRVLPKEPGKGEAVTTVEGFAMKRDDASGTDTLYVIERHKVPEISLDSLIRADSLRRLAPALADSLAADSASYVKARSKVAEKSTESPLILSPKPGKRTLPAESPDTIHDASPSDTTARAQVRKAFRRKKF